MAYTVTQEDRVAAWPYADFHCLPDSQMRYRWFSGYYDNLEQGHAIRAFARCRIKTLKRAEEVAEAFDDGDSDNEYSLAAKVIAAEIRNLKGKSNE